MECVFLILLNIENIKNINIFLLKQNILFLILLKIFVYLLNI